MFRPMPGVDVSNEAVSLATPQSTSAVPVFIGYTLQGETGRMVAIASWEEFLSVFCGELSSEDQAVLEESALYQSLRLYFDNGGGECHVLPAGLTSDIGEDASAISKQLIAALTGPALTDDDSVTLLCVPDILLLSQGPGFKRPWRDVWQAMLSVSYARLACFAVLDLPGLPTDAVEVLDGAEALDNLEFGATYWPHLECMYLKGDTRVLAPPSGAIAAQVQRTDRERGVWKAPANEALLQVLKPQYTLREGDQVFNQASPVNLIRSFAGRGVRVWGCQTMTPSTTSPWRYLQVRRLLGYVEAQLSALARFSVFEPNNEITWLKLKSLCRSWLRELWLSGALYGANEDEAFRLFVGLGESMSKDDLLAGRLILRVELSALYPAEYITLNLRLSVMEPQLNKEPA